MADTGSTLFSNAADKYHKNDEESLTPIQTFFSNTKIFLTGVTGFLGILIVEKLLFSCPNISTIYVLIRSKKGKDVDTRMKEVLNEEVFSRLKEKYPDFAQKIVPMEGDCEQPNLGLSLQDREMLIKNVDVVFHGAATVRFDEALKKASMINIRAVRDILELAHQMPKLKSFVHISTAYSNCVNKLIKEEFYPPAMDYNKLLTIVDGVDDDILTAVTSSLLGKFPNTYTFTKQIGEDVVRREGEGLPIGIHRPAIVLSTYKEPLPGWINNIYGPTGIMLAGGVGLVRTALIEADCKANMVPADLVVNSIIASAWDIAEKYAKDAAKDVPIYNFELDRGTKLTWGTYINTCQKYALKYYTSKAIWYPLKIFYRSRFAYDIATFLLETAPAAMVDSVRFCLRKPPMLMKVYKKIHAMEDMVVYFKTQEWDYESKNTDGLLERMSGRDRSIFFCDVTGMDWEDYLESHVRGIRLYLIKDPLETMPEGQKHLRKQYWLHQVTKTTLFAFGLWMLWLTLSLIYKYMF